MKKSILITGILSISVISHQVYAFCSDTVEATVNEALFVVDEELGVVTDADTGLMWSICNLGETWSADEKICNGSAKSYIWQDALKQSQQNRVANFSDWRLPNIKELMSIIERQCAEPAVNLALFPTTKNEPYWTSTPVFNSNSDNQVWAVQFKEGSNHESLKSRTALTRLVRKVTATE
ncbi:DUF1566 domain-containing protein [Catenovulum sp. 2E275]|uniref:Lcl C-terminal domain-containing protein n=1 Tax=Catenovulum sp. 2E275 TaxID=2980497 RepID=UPI0021D38BDF|nr:DUF1566 domain-containing protein [Catenovulum sp. 2E275]MCU4675973.1 DUF1566 domain-containing protein [Catenovulum sp. 2E275]